MLPKLNIKLLPTISLAFVDRLACGDKLDFGCRKGTVINHRLTWSGVSLPWMAFGYELKMGFAFLQYCG